WPCIGTLAPGGSIGPLPKRRARRSADAAAWNASAAAGSGTSILIGSSIAPLSTPARTRVSPADADSALAQPLPECGLALADLGVEVARRARVAAVAALRGAQASQVRGFRRCRLPARGEQRLAALLPLGQLREAAGLYRPPVDVLDDGLRADAVFGWCGHEPVAGVGPVFEQPVRLVE